MNSILTGPQRELRASSITALVKFDDSGPVPLALKLDGRRFDIERITYRWVTHRGAYAVYHFSALLVSGEALELSFDTGNMMWRINRLAEI